MKKLFYLLIYLYLLRNSYQLTEDESIKIIDSYSLDLDNKNNNNSGKNETGILESITDQNFGFSVFFITFGFIVIFSIILIIFDIKEDKKILNSYNLSNKERASQEFQSLKKTYINNNIILFACFLMKYTYPLFNIFFIYNYDHPRYIRFFILIINILANILLCTIFYYLCVCYEINNDNIIFLFLIFIFSLFVSFIIYILNQIITKKALDYDKIRKEIWGPKYESIKKYIYYTVKKDILFNSKWKSIRNRILSYTRICGDSIVSGKPDDKYKIYAENKIKCNITTLNDGTSIKSSKSSENKEKENEIFHENYISTTFNIRLKENNSLLGFNMKRKKTYLSKNGGNNFNSKLCIEKSVEPFTFSKLGQNHMKLKTVKKLEDINNRYILNNNDINFDETSDFNSTYAKTYDNLEIETLENYTYISIDSMKSQIHNANSEFNVVFGSNMTTLALILLLIIIDLGLICMYQLIKEKNNKNNYFNECVYPVLAQIIIFNFIINYLFALLISAIVFKFYGYHRRKCLKIIFKLFIEKFIRYIYRIRLLMKKYYKELEFIEK